MGAISKEQKDTLWQRFHAIKKRPLPTGDDLPASPEEAAKIGFQKGLQTGYGEGLVAGVELGMDIGMSPSSDELLTGALN